MDSTGSRLKMQTDENLNAQSALEDISTGCTAEGFSQCRISRALRLLPPFRKHLLLQDNSPAVQVTPRLLALKDHLLEKRRRAFEGPGTAREFTLHLLYLAVFALVVMGLLHWNGKIQLPQGKGAKDCDQSIETSPWNVSHLPRDGTANLSDIYPLYKRLARSISPRKWKEETSLLAIYQSMKEVKEILLPCDSLVKITHYVLRKASGETLPLDLFPLETCDQKLNSQITKINPLDLVKVKVKPQLLYQVLLFLKRLDLLVDIHQAKSFSIVKKLLVNKQQMILGKTGENHNKHVLKWLKVNRTHRKSFKPAKRNQAMLIFKTPTSTVPSSNFLAPALLALPPTVQGEQLHTK